MSQSDRLLQFLALPGVWAAVVGIVGFLALTWLIRQAPLGQAGRPESAAAPSAARRDRAVILAVVGFLLILLGGFLAVEFGVAASIPAFAGGIALVQWVLRTYRAYRHESPTIRRLIAFAETGLTAALLLGVLLVGNVLAFRLGGRPIDLTKDRAFTLSTLSLGQVRTLDRPVTLTVFFGNSERSIRQLDRVRQLVDLYHAADPTKVKVEYLNPFADVKEFEELARRVPEVATAASDGIVVAYGAGADAPRVVLGTRDLFDAAPASGTGDGRFASTFRGEDVITSSLIRLREGKRTRVAFTTGHGEPSTTDGDPNRPGYGIWRARLASIGADVTELNLLANEIPAGVDLLVIGGPKSPFQPAEIERIRQYLARGGPIIALVDNQGENGLADLLATYNVTINPGIVADSKYQFNGQPTIIYAPLAPSLAHPIVTPLAGQVVLLQNAAPLGVLGGGAAAGPGAAKSAGKAANPGIIATPLLRSSPDSWTESDPATRPIQFDRGKETAGPLVVGVAATTRPAIAAEAPVPRMVVFASPSLADNRLLRTEATNIDVLMNAVSWLRARPELIGIAPKTHESLLFAADPGLQLRLVMIPTLAAAIVIVGLGLATWIARRD